MSYSDGWAAIHLEKTARVPRTEYSAHEHWALLERVTGIKAGFHSPAEDRLRAQQAFFKAWDYDFFWNIWVDAKIFGEKRTFMGHAEYAAEGFDYSPKVVSYFNDYEEVLRFDPPSEYGVPDRGELIRQLNANYASMRQFVPDAVNMTGVYVSCVSGLIDMFGWELLLEACGYEPEQFGHVVDRYADFILPYFEAVAACDSPVIMVHDDMVWTSGAIFRRAFYERYVFPNLKRCIAPLVEAGKKVMFTSDGTFTDFIDDIAALGVHGFVMEPTTDMARIAEKYGKTHVFIGNADTRILLSGSREDIYNEVKRCMDIGKACNGFFLAVGNHIPANTPVENALYYNECYEKLGRR